MAARKKSSTRKYGKAAGKSVKRAMHKKKTGTLKSGAGKHGKVKSREQAIAIGLSEARKAGGKVPRKKSSSRKSSSRKKSASRTTTKRKSSRKKSSRKKSSRKG
jgi:hypothetical protein